MQTETIPFFYWPTKLMLVDDDVAFLESFSFQLGESLLPMLNKNAYTALETLKAQGEKIAALVSPLISAKYGEVSSAKKLDYQEVIDLIYDKDRFSVVSTVLVDYLMPGVNGLELCEKIEELPVKKIMLTGEAGNQLGVSAFNRGVIDSFLLKDINGAVEKLTQTILKMKQAYFSDVSLNLMGTSAINEFKQQTEYVDIFRDFIEEYKIEEYYQIDYFGSYLGFDRLGSVYWLIVRSDDQFREALDILKYSDNVNSSIVNPLKERSHLLFLFSETEKQLPTSDWHDFLFPVVKSFRVNQKSYYCSMIFNEFFDLEKEKIFSFHRYKLESQHH